MKILVQLCPARRFCQFSWGGAGWGKTCFLRGEARLPFSPRGGTGRGAHPCCTHITEARFPKYQTSINYIVLSKLLYATFYNFKKFPFRKLLTFFRSPHSLLDRIKRKGRRSFLRVAKKVRIRICTTLDSLSLFYIWHNYHNHPEHLVIVDELSEQLN